MKYLIISTNAMGDTYLSASAINVIKVDDKDAEIDFISTFKCKPILDVLNLNNIYIVEKKFFSLLKTIFLVRKIKYDYVFNFFPGLVNTFLFMLAKSKKRSGYINLIRRKDWYSRKQKLVAKGTKQKKLIWLPNDNYLDRVKLALSVFFNSSALSAFQKKIMEISISNSKFSDSIIIHPFSRSKERSLNYPVVKELVSYFQKLNSVYVIGEKQDFLEMNEASIPAFADLKFLELVEVILSCKLFIAVDSFPIHIADAHNSNFIGIFGPTNPKAVLVNHEKAINFRVTSLDTVSYESLFNGIEHFLKH